jgi:hypothetical protein
MNTQHSPGAWTHRSLGSLNHREQLVPPRLGQAQFGGEQIAIGIEGVQERVDATLISHI